MFNVLIMKCHYMVTMAIGVNTVAKLVVGLMMVMLLVVISMILVIRDMVMVVITMITHAESSKHREENQHNSDPHDVIL